MELQKKLTSFTKENTVRELNAMLHSTHQVSISWWGERVVSIQEYDGEVTINELASKYLDCDSFNADQEGSLQDRLDCANLWETIEHLYVESDTVLSSTWIYKYLVPLIEFRIGCRCCSGDPRALIQSDVIQRKANLFAFTFDRYKELWGDPGEEVHWVGVEDSRKYYATKEMIELKVSGHIKG